jgi:hypothetical protein
VNKMTVEVVGLLAVVVVGGLAVANRMGWRPRLWDRLRAHRELRRATRWLKRHRPSQTGTWTGQEWLEAQDAVGGGFLLYPSDLRPDGPPGDGTGDV